ncbi:PaaI family thioesterase [Riemerella columbipharyngis]|uniref:1,4-dihydroxy-2-naphthoyl-CoA hydrolase n=1 Tax=Riemerella columbipharyngis TaxID=1071918 RepID=A0A1G6YAC9_9FLAO|nr:PaaI family thioesterase [Riemerella columbipharyngis]SDD87358.1 1,4-dihydroxy-2-naphthoyl-CoA hydrolase [Riemerella columbipharyngis]
MNEDRKEEILHFLNNWSEEHLAKNLGIIFTDVTEDSLTATMPVNKGVHQPFGIMHGGASCVLAETLGSCLSNVSIDQKKYYAVGTNITSNHLRSKRNGMVTGVAQFLRKGRTVHVSTIEIRDENDQLINHTTMTNNIIKK